ncbi:MAG TPA: recombinase RecA [Armatimonadetes bacterium]|nr:recombinase RecA [Armatimonadota bacterium]
MGDRLELLETGVPGLDEVLGGGIPAYSVSVVCGPPGSGKTTLCQQIVFNQAKRGRRGLYLTTLSEPALKMMRYQGRFSFFDPSLLGEAVIYADLGSVARERGLQGVVEAVMEHLKEVSPAVVAIDSFKALQDLSQSAAEFRRFTYELAVRLSTWECAAFLVGEYSPQDLEREPAFAIADGVIELSMEGTGMVRRRFLEVRKLRGLAPIPGKHAFEITPEGVVVYPRLRPPKEIEEGLSLEERIGTGIPDLDAMLGGGLAKGSWTLVAGPAGTGKTVLCLHFAKEGIERGEPVVFCSLQEGREQLIEVALGFGWDFEGAEREGRLKFLCKAPAELDPEPLASELISEVRSIGARRVVIDSITEIGASVGEESRLRDYLFGLFSALRREGATVMVTQEVPELFGVEIAAVGGISYLSDNVILLRYVEIQSRITRAITVLKARGSQHEKLLREFRITPKGLEVLEPFSEYSGVVSGIPTLVRGEEWEGLSAREGAVLRALRRAGEASAEELAERLSMPLSEVEGALAELASLGYILRFEKGGRVRYRAV